MICDNCKKKFDDTMCFVESRNDLYTLVNSIDVMDNETKCMEFVKEDKPNIITVLFSKVSSILSSIKSNIKYGLIYRAKYGFDVRETWDLDVHLAKYIYPRLKYLSEHTQSFPARLENDDFLEENRLVQYKDKDGFETWRNIMIVMLDYFKTKGDDSFDFCVVPNEEGFRLFTLFWNDLWD